MRYDSSSLLASILEFLTSLLRSYSRMKHDRHATIWVYIRGLRHHFREGALFPQQLSLDKDNNIFNSNQVNARRWVKAPTASASAAKEHCSTLSQQQVQQALLPTRPVRQRARSCTHGPHNGLAIRTDSTAFGTCRPAGRKVCTCPIQSYPYISQQTTECQRTYHWFGFGLCHQDA